MSFKCDRCGGGKFTVNHTYWRFGFFETFFEGKTLTRFPKETELSWWDNDPLEHKYIASCCNCLQKWASHTTLDDLKEEMENAGVLT